VDIPRLQGLQGGVRYCTPSGDYQGLVRFDILNYFPVPITSTSDKSVSTSKSNGYNFL